MPSEMSQSILPMEQSRPAVVSAAEIDPSQAPGSQLMPWEINWLRNGLWVALLV